MKLYRIASLRHPIFSPIGAIIKGGRWNSPGVPVIYMATSLAGAKLEMLAHNGGFGNLPKGFGFVDVDVPDDIAVTRFPSSRPPSLTNSIIWGDEWLQSGLSLVALVPSKASPGDWNALINPDHPGFSRLRPSREKSVRWDARHFTK
jgi:RES domain-containing protein